MTSRRLIRRRPYSDAQGDVFSGRSTAPRIRQFTLILLQGLRRDLDLNVERHALASGNATRRHLRFRRPHASSINPILVEELLGRRSSSLQYSPFTAA